MDLRGINSQPFVREPASAAGVPGSQLPGGDISPVAAPGYGVSATVSKPAEMFLKLRQLKEKDGDVFIEVVSTLTEKLKTAAALNEGDLSGRLLSDLAARFEDVANGGDLVALQAPPPPGASPWQPPPETLGQRSNLDQLFSGFNAALDQALQ
jgi:hypothetical protein